MQTVIEYLIRSISKLDACQHLSPLIIAMSLSLNHPFSFSAFSSSNKKTKQISIVLRHLLLYLMLLTMWYVLRMKNGAHAKKDERKKNISHFALIRSSPTIFGPFPMTISVHLKATTTS